MALITPYSDAMRIGMGLNSFTQQLCHNAVRPAGGREAASDPPQYKQSTTPEGGNVDISHDVAWTAKFVDRISQVTHSLHVSAAAPIKYDFASIACFVDANDFLESDVNYLVQVRVKQSLAAPGLPEFEPIPNLTHTNFTRVYGDSFIAGFIEGGEFNALISVKVNDRSKENQVKQQLAAYLSFKATPGDLVKPVPIDGEANIAVSWRGGGDITVAEWTLESLKAVMAEFPGKAMKRPARMHAIIAKYSSLQAFSETDIEHIDYDQSAQYACTLLDAYADYKLTWHNISQTIRKVEQGDCALLATEGILESTDLLSEVKTPPNRLVPYTASIYGLEKAKRDCEFEILKIKQEVDAVGEDPQVAYDHTRLQQFLPPALFRMLLPAPPKNPYCPVALQTPVRFLAECSGKSMDYDFHGGTGSMSLHQYDAVNTPNQKFEILPFSSKGFYIRHIASGRFLTISATVGARRVYMTFADFPSVFTFERQVDSAAFMIRLAEQSQFTLNVESGAQHNGTKLLVWAGDKGRCDKWYIKSFDDMSI